MKKVVFFASGSGSNIENITNYFKSHSDIEFSCVFVNNPDAFVIERCKKLHIKTILFGKEEFKNGNILNELLKINPDLIVLAGFLWLMPSSIIEKFPNKMINIHPALLPKYGGKGMYGMNVHRAVKENNESESGITIHFVNSHYDEGKIIFQAKCSVTKSDTAESIAQKVHGLEYEHFPKMIEKLLQKN